MNEPRGKLHSLFEKNFLEYTAYVVKERAIPCIDDGLKPVQRRILQTLHNMDDGRFNKVANVVGETMKLHPHGDQSIFAALVNLANKDLLIEKQGNFGNIYTGDQASAARYIECRLTPLAREILFNKDLTDYEESYDGRMQEPVVLPAKIPLILMLGAEGIAVGMATKIMPHNFCELLEAQKSVLRGEEIELYPDFQQGGLLDATNYEDGNGKLRCRARIEEVNDKTIVIREIPYNITTQGLIDSVEKAAKAGKIKIQSINDYTAENVEVEIKLARGVYAKDIIKALYAFTDCEISITPNLTLIQDNSPITLSVTEVLYHTTQKLVKDLRRELEIDLSRLQDKLHARLLEQIFIEERLYKTIEEQTTYAKVIKSVEQSLEPFTEELEQAVTREDIERLLEIRIKRISRYDINKQAKEIRSIRADIKAIKHHLKDMVKYTIGYLDKILDKYGKDFPRKTELTSFKEVVMRKVALSNLNMVYNREDGFLGHQVKAGDEKNDISFQCSEYDKLLLIYNSGKYKVISVADKVFVGNDLAWVGKVKRDLVFNLIYRDGKENLVYVKRFKTPKFILDKEYALFAEHKRSKILLLSFDDNKHARVSLMPSPRAKSNVVQVAFDDYLIKGPAARGKRVSPRVARRVVDSTGQAIKEQKKNMVLPGVNQKDEDQPADEGASES